MRYINPSVTYSSINHEQYTLSDINMYYGNTYLLYDNGDTWQVVLFCGVNEETARVRCPVGNEIDAPYSSLYKFTLEQGFYKVGKRVITYEYSFTKTYKKGLTNDLVRLCTLGSLSGLSNHPTLSDIVTVVPKESKDIVIISRRIAAYRNKLWQLHRQKTVGDFKDGEFITPIAPLQDRIREGIFL